MAKARQVGEPQSPQLVLGRSLKIWIPVSPILVSFQIDDLPLPTSRRIYTHGFRQVFWLGVRPQALPSRASPVVFMSFRPPSQRRVRDGIAPSSLLKRCRYLLPPFYRIDSIVSAGCPFSVIYASTS